MKKALLFVMCVALILSMIGCGTGSKDVNSGKTEQTPDAQSTTSTEETKAADTLSGTLEIQYFVGGYGDTWWKDTIADFQALHPNLKIEQLAGPKINEQTKPRWIAGNPPDFVYIDGDGTFTEDLLVESDHLM